jgi:hypothetical protein
VKDEEYDSRGFIVPPLCAPSSAPALPELPESYPAWWRQRFGDLC